MELCPSSYETVPPRTRFVGWALVVGFLINSPPHFFISSYYTTLFVGAGLFLHIPLILVNAVGLAVVFAAGRNPTIKENEQFKTYRRAVLRGPHSSDDFWIMAERIMHEYTRKDDA